MRRWAASAWLLVLASPHFSISVSGFLVEMGEMVRSLTNKVPLKVHVTVTDAEMSTRRIACVELGLRRIVPASSWRRRVGRAELASPNRRRRVVLDLSL